MRTLISRDFARVFESCDVLVCPTSPTVAFEIGALVDDPLAMYACDLFTLPVNLAGLPGLSIPCGLSEGLPVGFQLVGPAFSENTLLAAGHALERAFAFDPRAAARSTEPPREQRPGRLGGRDRPRDPRAAEHAQQDVLPLPERVRRRAEHPHLPRLHGASRGAPRAEPRRGREVDHGRSRARLARSPSDRLFYRKNYFYPDSPKAYQIIAVRRAPVPRRLAGGRGPDGTEVVRFVRAHLEEDAAKTIHAGRRLRAGSRARPAPSSTSTAAARPCSRS